MQEEKGKQLWNIEFIMVLIISCFSMCGSSFVTNIMSTFIVDELNGTAAQVGTLYSLMIFCAFLSRPLSGFLVDRIGRKKTLLTAMALSTILNLLLLTRPNFFQLSVLRFLAGVPFALNSISLATLIADTLPRERLAEGIGINAVITAILGSVVAPYLSFWFLDRYGYAFNFIFSAILTVIAMALIVILKYTDIKNPSIPFSVKTSFEPKVGWISLILALFFAGTPIIGSFSPLYANELGLASRGTFFVFYGVGSLLTIPFNQRLVKKNWPNKAAMLALFLLTAGFAIIGFIRSIPAFLMGGFIIGTGFGIASSTFQAMALNMVSQEERGKCNATTQLGCDLGAVIGSTAFGYVAEATGSYQPQFSANAIFMLVPILLTKFVVLPHFQKKHL